MSECKEVRDAYYKESVEKNRSILRNGQLVLPLSWIRSYDISNLIADVNLSYLNPKTQQEFEEYAKSNNLNIELNMKIIKYDNTADLYSYFKSLVKSLIKKPKRPYEIYFYDSRFTSIYSPYLLNLNDYLEKEYIEKYDAKAIEEECYNENELVGIPFCTSYKIMYSNIGLLNKYNKSVPKTWDELIKTCKYIIKKENDPNLICYNGLFDDSEQGLYSLYEFIYSCRDSYNSTYPEPKDPSFITSLNMLQKLKNETDSEGRVFKSNEDFTFTKLINNRAIFLKYWLLGEPLISMIHYKPSIMPGIKEGISGTIALEYNIGIAKNMTEEEKYASLEVVKYFTSKKYQRNMFVKGLCATTHTEVLNDKEICEYAPCDLIKEIQFTGEPLFIKKGPRNYSKKYKEYIYKFLYYNESINRILKYIDDITKTYYISLKTENSYVGLVCFIFISTVSALMILSLIALFNYNFQPFLMFLPTGFWFITVLGCVLIIWIPFTNYGLMKSSNCHLKQFIMSIGFTFNLCPIICKLISQFPEENKLSAWVSKNKYIFILLNILMDVLFYSISFIDKYTVKLVVVEDGENFEICDYNICFAIFIVYKCIVVFILLFLIFVEWNISETIYDIKFIISALYIDILSFILLLFFYFINLKLYIPYFLIQTFNTSIISITNYSLFYGFRVLLGILKKQNVKVQFINSINDKFINNNTQMQRRNYTDSYNDNSIYKNTFVEENDDCVNSGSVPSNRPSNILTKIMDYHYSRETSNINSLSSFSSGNY